MMRFAFAFLLVLHGLIHAMGFLKAFGLASLPQLTLPISRPLGLRWLAAGLTLLATVGALYATPRWWWLAAAVAAVLSQGVIATSWRDARFGTIANAILVLGAVWGFCSTGPTSLRAEYETDTTRLLTPAGAPRVVTEADLVPLPPLVQRYLRIAGVVGQPMVRSFRVRLTGRIRKDATSPWMPFAVEQHSSVAPPARLFFMSARMFGLPVDGYHRYVDGAASMRVKVLAALGVVDARGPSFTATETVTLLNDLCVMAPAALIDPAIRWEPLDGSSVRATFTAAGHTVRAVLVFDAGGALADFWSDDRPALAADGVHFESQRWSTPILEYGSFGPQRLPRRAEARYAPATGAYAYGEFVVEEVEYNGGAGRRGTGGR